MPMPSATLIAIFWLASLGEIDALRVHASHVVADLVGMVAAAGIIGDQHNADRKRNQEDGAQHVEPEQCDAGMFRAAQHG